MISKMHCQQHHYSIVQKNTNNLSPSFDLNLTSVRTKDAGQYFCLVNNKAEGQDRVDVEVVGEQQMEKEQVENNK